MWLVPCSLFRSRFFEPGPAIHSVGDPKNEPNGKPAWGDELLHRTSIEMSLTVASQWATVGLWCTPEGRRRGACGPRPRAWAGRERPLRRGLYASLCDALGTPKELVEEKGRVP